MRRVRTVVLPVPAPATTSIGPQTCSIASRWRSSSTIEARGVDFTDDIVGSIAEDSVDMPVRIRALQASWDTAIAVAAIAAVSARRTVLPREAGIHSDSLNRESS